MTISTIFIYIAGVIISWIVFYYVVKSAIKNGIREARSDKEVQNFIGNNTPERPPNLAQVRLQQQYDKGEITFEEFQTQWNKLSN